MKTEIIKAEDYGLKSNQANELTIGLKVVKAERELLIKEFEEVSKLELTQKNLPKFKELRLKIVKNRTQGINKWHKTNKEFFLTGGKFVDAIKNKENGINEMMEEKLMDAEKHFENLENKRLSELQSKRVSLLSKYVEDANERNLSGMENDVWDAYLSTKKDDYLKVIEANKKIEADRIEAEKKEKAEQERIRKENEKLKKDADIAEQKLISEQKERERIAKIETNKREKEEEERIEKARLLHVKQLEKEQVERAKYEAKIQSEREAKEKIEREERIKRQKLEAELKSIEDAENKRKEEADTKTQLELKKGDSERLVDLISDLETLKIKYAFKSDKNIKMYKDVGLLVDKVINHIQK